LPFVGSPAKGNVPATGQIAALARERSAWADPAYDALRTQNPEVANTIFPNTIPPEAKALKAQIDALKANLPAPEPIQPWARNAGSPTAGERRIADLQAQYNRLVPPMNDQEAAFAKLLKQPYARSALSDAKTLGLIGDVTEPTGQPSFEKMFNIKKNIEAAADRAFDQTGGGDLGRRLRQVQRAVEDHIAENVPGYSDVTAEYARRMGLERALDIGKKAWTTPDSRGIGEIISRLTPDELQQYRYAMASEFVSRLRGTNSDTFSAALAKQGGKGEDIIGALPDKLTTIFGRNVTSFMQRAAVEADMARFGDAVGNSKTALRTAMQNADPFTIALKGMTSGLAGGMNVLKSGLLRVAAGRTLAEYNQETAQALEPLLMTRGTPAIDAMLKSFQTPPAPSGLPAAMAQAGGAAQRLMQP
jgi:hypothetical protein